MGYIVGGNVKHKGCCNDVMKVLNSTTQFAIGVIDEDKRQPTIDPGFVKYEFRSSYNKTHISFYPHNDGKRFLFKVYKAMDQFVWDAAREMGASLRDIGYPADEKGFRKVTKSEDAAENPKLRRLFVQIKDYPELVAFRNTIRYLINTKYEADVETAKRFFDGRLTAEDLNQYLRH
ncbi:MAG: hypothetical protein SOZ87_07390 [Candidatus Cryptobacteroides sp.]|nr:hypothetical protein [Candidatus Cryptobacteroides sp.]